MNLDTVMQGLAITVVGMTLVFLALGLIVVAMVLMGRLLRPKPTTEERAPVPTPGAQERAKVAAMVAAIVAAKHLAQPRASDARQSVSGQPGMPSPWTASHRAQALARRLDH